VGRQKAAATFLRCIRWVACASGSEKVLIISTQPRSGPSSPASSRMVRARASHPLSTAHSPMTFPVIQATVRAARPAAML
jgi:hypothetical protein